MTDAEATELLFKAKEFNEAFVDLMQCVNRMILNDGLDKKTVRKAQEDVRKIVKTYEGNACTNCGMFMLVRTGTCFTCMSCGWNGGCG